MGLSPKVFWEMEYGEVVMAIMGFVELKQVEQEAEWKRNDEIVKAQWNAVRWQTAALLASISGQSTAPTDLLKLPWDKEEITEFVIEKPMTNKQLQKCAKAWNIDLSQYQ